jgi:putative endonuclease
MVARGYRSPRRRGEIDLMGWEKDVLCLIEVKTWTSRDVKPAEAAVDSEKRRKQAGMAREYLRRLPDGVQWRFDAGQCLLRKSTGRARLRIGSKMPSLYRKI